MKERFKKPELLAPAGNLEKMKTAFAFGADAVYLGIPDFSLRVRINDFTISQIRQAVKYAHQLGKKVYVTVNIFAHNAHIRKLPEHIKVLKKIRPDGLFISDPGVLTEVRKIWPEAKIILSTQANCTNWQAVIFWQKLGVARIILARELSLEEIKEIRKKAPAVELECFVHGAMCMAYSGRCFLSKYFSDRDANLGDCVQPCRWFYTRKEQKQTKQTNGSGSLGKNYSSILVRPEDRNEIMEISEDKSGSYILNSQDLCLIKRLPELRLAGIDAFKIEGRAKSVYYIANVVGAYRKAIDLVAYSPQHATCNMQHADGNKKVLEFLYNELEQKLFHRGFTEGFMFGQGKLAQNIEDSHKDCKWEFCGQAIKNKKLKIKNKKFNSDIKKFYITVRIHNTMRIKDYIEIVRPKYDIIKMKVEKMWDAKTGKEIKEAHGGGSQDIAIIEVAEEVPEYSVIRRRVGNL